MTGLTSETFDANVAWLGAEVERRTEGRLTLTHRNGWISIGSIDGTPIVERDGMRPISGISTRRIGIPWSRRLDRRHTTVLRDLDTALWQAVIEMRKWGNEALADEVGASLVSHR